MCQFTERARELDVQARIEWLGQAPTRAELLALARECDAGLALMPLESDDVNEQAMAGASNKPFDYMACGLGLIVSDLPDWRALFVETGFGRACDPADPASIAGAVRWYIEHETERAAQGERAQEKIMTDWNYETQFAPVLRELDGA
jgi:glycosyltransferase involved in cell wall biosynthesis